MSVCLCTVTRYDFFVLTDRRLLLPCLIYILPRPYVWRMRFYLLISDTCLWLFFILLYLETKPFCDNAFVNDFDDSLSFLPFDTDFLPPSLWVAFLLPILLSLTIFGLWTWKYSVLIASSLLVSNGFLFDLDFFPFPGLRFSFWFESLFLSFFLLKLHLLKYSLCCLIHSVLLYDFFLFSLDLDCLHFVILP